MSDTALISNDQLGLDIDFDALERMEPGSDATELGDGYAYIDNLDPLVGKYMYVLQVRRSEGGIAPSVNVWVQTREPISLPGVPGSVTRKVRFHDSGTGIKAQLWDITPDRLPLLCRRGLNASHYTYQDPQTGRDIPASTYYIDVNLA